MDHFRVGLRFARDIGELLYDPPTHCKPALASFGELLSLERSKGKGEAL